MLQAVTVNRHEAANVHCKKSAIRNNPVRWKSLIAMHKCWNMWTRHRELLRQSHAIL